MFFITDTRGRMGRPASIYRHPNIAEYRWHQQHLCGKLLLWPVQTGQGGRTSHHHQPFHRTTRRCPLRGLDAFYEGHACAMSTRFPSLSRFIDAFREKCKRRFHFLSFKNFLKRATGMFKHTTQLFYHKSIISRKIWTANVRFTFS